MIEFDDVLFSYGSRPVLKNISFSIRANEKVAVLGGSGEGKTTILKLVLGLLQPDSGKILIQGEDITAKSEDELREFRMKFSIVFQEGALFDSLSVRENVAFCLREYTRMPEQEIEDKVRALLRRVGMEDAIDLMPEELSGGMQRRVAVMRSLAVLKPVMFLYDEPTGGLDPVNADIVYKLIADLSNGEAGFLMVTHDVRAAIRAAQRFLLLDKGRLIFDGSREKLVQLEVPEVQLSIREWGKFLEL
jgi:phospholipid/cholesterol/gamma-HCH transport system ATP-binding protein